jgi:tetratricopeptide (TPR) repeat protein
MMRPRPSPPLIASLGVIILIAIAHTVLGQQGRKEPGSVMEPFACRTADGTEFRFSAPSDCATILIFVAPHQKRSDRALDDLLSLAAEVIDAEHRIQLLVIVSGDAGVDYFENELKDDHASIVLLEDTGDVLWGELGIIVTPTTILVDPDGVVSWTRAGHGFDFSVEAEMNLKSALGIEPREATEDAPAEPVSPPPDRSELGRRHLRMAQFYARRGDLEQALDEGRRAAGLMPDTPHAQIELARLLCLNGRADEALDVTRAIEATTDEQRAQVMMLSGWAHRLNGEFELALPQLEQSIDLDPSSGRAHYELGKLLEATGGCEAAMKAYRQSLNLVFAARPIER